MTDVRVVALERVLSRRKKLDKTLNTALSRLREEQSGLSVELSARRAAVADQATVLASQAQKIDAMMSGASGGFCADEFLRQREFQATLTERHVALQEEADRVAQHLSQKESELAEMKTRVVVNRARMSIYQDRRDDICRAIAFAAEEAQDEESMEARRAPVVG